MVKWAVQWALYGETWRQISDKINVDQVIICLFQEVQEHYHFKNILQNNIFGVRVFREIPTDYNLDLRFLVKSKLKMADLSWGHMNIFRGDTIGLCFSWVYKRSLLVGYVKN